MKTLNSITTTKTYINETLNSITTTKTYIMKH